MRIHGTRPANPSSGFVLFSSWLGFIGWGGITILDYSVCLLTWLGCGGTKIPVDSFFLYAGQNLAGKSSVKQARI